MAIVKHIKSRNANYSAAINYLLFEHNEKTGKKEGAVCWRRIRGAPAFFILLYFAAMQTSAPHTAVLTESVIQSRPANGCAPSRNCLAGSAPAFIGRRCPCWIPFRSST